MDCLTVGNRKVCNIKIITSKMSFFERRLSSIETMFLSIQCLTCILQFDHIGYKWMIVHCGFSGKDTLLPQCNLMSEVLIQDQKKRKSISLSADIQLQFWRDNFNLLMCKFSAVVGYFW